MVWLFQKARDAFQDLRGRWDDLNKSCGNHVLLDSEFVSSLLRHFGSDDTLLGISDSGMVFLERTRRGFWQTFQPAQGPLGLILLQTTKPVEEHVADLMRCLPGFCLGLSITQQDPDFTALKNMNHSLNFETVDYITTSRIRLTGEFEPYWKARGRYFVDDLRRQTRRLEEQGIRIEFSVERQPGRVAECIGEYGRLEATGWKGTEGTAVTAENQQGRFYRDVLEKFCTKGEGAIYRLLFSGKVVATDLCLERNGMMAVLKIAYDESLAGISPGKFLHREILRQLFQEQNIEVVEWYGRLHEWQKKLDSSPRTMFHVNFYRHSWVPVAKSYFKRSLQLINGVGEASNV